MNGINEFKIVIETHPSIKKKDVEGIVREALGDLHPNVYHNIRFKHIEMTNKPGTFVEYDPQEDD
jgi:hypothetical protein